MVELLKKNKKILFIMMLAGIVYWYIAGLNNLLWVQEDSAIYIILAKSLGSGLGATYTASPQNAASHYYPLLFPLMLIPGVMSFPGHYMVLELVSLICALVFFVVLFYFIKNHYQDEYAWLAVLLVACNPLIFYYSHQILTEIPYTLFSTLALYVLVTYCRQPQIVSRYLFAALLAVSLAINTRLIGATLLIAAVVFLFYKKARRKGTFIGLVSMLLLAGWAVRNIVLDRSVYVGEFISVTSGSSDLIQRWVYNLGATVGKEMTDLFFFPFLSSLDPYSRIFIVKVYLGIIITVLICAGFLIKVQRKGMGLEDVYVVLYFFFGYLSWTRHSSRYLVPLLPFFIYYIIQSLAHFIPQNKGAKIAVLLWLLLTFSASSAVMVKEKTQPFNKETQSFVTAVDWLQQHVDKTKIIISRYPAWLYVYTGGIRGVKFLLTQIADIQYSHILDQKADYMIIDQNKVYRDDARDYLVPVVNKYKDNFRLVYSSPEEPKTCIYEVLR